MVSKASKSCIRSKRNILPCRHFRINNVMIVERKRNAAATDAIMIAKFVLSLEKVVLGDEIATGVSECGKLQILDENRSSEEKQICLESVATTVSEARINKASLRKMESFKDPIKLGWQLQRDEVK